MVERVARLLFLLSLIVALALWAKGYAEVGDGFSAGAVAGLGAIGQYVCLRREVAARVVGARWGFPLMYGGLMLVLLLMVAPLFFGVAPVTHLPSPGGKAYALGVIDVHTSLLFDLGIGVLVYGGLVCTFDRIFTTVHRGQS